MAAQNVLAGYPLEDEYPELKDCILVCATEKRTAEDRAAYLRLLQEVLERSAAGVPRPAEPTTT